MKERPILFSAPMVRAILEGRKTQTRRAAKHPLLETLSRIIDCGNGWWGDEEGEIQVRCPYGQPGDRLWVRETWNWFDPEEIPSDRRGNRAPFTGCQGERKIPWVCAYAADGQLNHPSDGAKALWCPSIHMPRWASRILLEVVSVRVERLQDISEADAEAEGAPLELGELERVILGAKARYRSGFCRLWSSINGCESWDANPWVWVVEFRRVIA